MKTRKIQDDITLANENFPHVFGPQNKDKFLIQN